MEEYTKPPLTYGEQVALLKSRGLRITDEKRIEEQLANISYYRLSAYMRPFKEKKEDGISDIFREGISWENIWKL